MILPAASTAGGHSLPPSWHSKGQWTPPMDIRANKHFRHTLKLQHKDCRVHYLAPALPLFRPHRSFFDFQFCLICISISILILATTRPRSFSFSFIFILFFPFKNNPRPQSQVISAESRKWPLEGERPANHLRLTTKRGAIMN